MARHFPPADLERALERYASIDPPLGCWLGGDGADPGLDYCRDCAETAIAEGNGEFIDGGYAAGEHDGCCHCSRCGCLLDYWLTDHGVRSELEHFSHRRFRRAPDREEAFHILRVLQSAPDNRSAIRLARRACAAIAAATEAR